MKTIEVFAPVNLAWIKYMGKQGQPPQPTNPSVSVTLSRLGTWVKLQVLGHVQRPDQVQFEWPIGFDPKDARRMERFLTAPVWTERLDPLSWPARVQIETKNTAPTATGVATSSSAFASFTWAWSSALVLPRPEWATDRSLLAEISAQGSGSSCRSFLGPLVSWSENGVNPLDFPFSSGLGIIVVVADAARKEVSSSLAHERVKMSPFFSGRAQRVQLRLQKLNLLLASWRSRPLWDELSELIFEEAMDMHELFHSSDPPFSYLKKKKKKVIEAFQSRTLGTHRVLLSFDAGANPLLFFHPDDRDVIWSSLRFKLGSDVVLLEDQSGSQGVHHV